MSISVVDENFVLKVVNGNGEVIEQLDPHVPHTIIFRESHYVALKEGESEKIPPCFVKQTKNQNA